MTYIYIREEVNEDLDDRLDNATKYNGAIFRLTINSGKKDSGCLSKYHDGNHGDIIKDIDEEVQTLKDMKAVVKALIGGLNEQV